jgi:hypothetical protein
MVYDINPDLFRERYVLPLYEKNRRYVTKKSTSKMAEEYFYKARAKFIGRVIREKESRASKQQPRRSDVVILLEGSGEIYALNQNIFRLGYGAGGTSPADRKREKEKREVDDEFFRFCANNLPHAGAPPLEFTVTSSGKEFLIETPGRHAIPMPPAVLQLFKRTYMHEFTVMSAKRLKSFMVDEVAKYAIVTSSFEQYF